MNLGKFHKVIRDLDRYFVENEIQTLFQYVVKALNTQSTVPTLENAELFRSRINSLYEGLREVPAFSNLGSFKQILEETGGVKYFGEGLEEQVNFILSKQFFRP